MMQQPEQVPALSSTSSTTSSSSSLSNARTPLQIVTAAWEKYRENIVEDMKAFASVWILGDIVICKWIDIFSSSSSSSSSTTLNSLVSFFISGHVCFAFYQWSFVLTSPSDLPSTQICMGFLSFLFGFFADSCPVWLRLPLNHGVSFAWTMILSVMRGGEENGEEGCDGC